MKYLISKRRDKSPEQDLKEFMSYLEQKNLISVGSKDSIVHEFMAAKRENKENIPTNEVEALSPTMAPNKTSMSNEQGFVISENSSQY